MSNKTDLQNNNAILGDTPNGLIGGVSKIKNSLNNKGITVEQSGANPTFEELKSAIDNIETYSGSTTITENVTLPAGTYLSEDIIIDIKGGVEMQQETIKGNMLWNRLNELIAGGNTIISLELTDKTKTADQFSQNGTTLSPSDGIAKGQTVTGTVPYGSLIYRMSHIPNNTNAWFYFTAPYLNKVSGITIWQTGIGLLYDNILSTNPELVHSIISAPSYFYDTIRYCDSEDFILKYF